jgi:hypothetical protein
MHNSQLQNTSLKTCNEKLKKVNSIITGSLTQEYQLLYKIQNLPPLYCMWSPSEMKQIFLNMYARLRQMLSEPKN